MLNIKFGNIQRSKKRVLIIDTDLVLNSILKTKLKHAGLAVECVKSSDDAREQIKKNIPNLILMDNCIPAADSLALLKQIKETRSLKSVPVFVLAGESEIESIERALNLGASNYIVKPVDPGVLLEKIKKTIVSKKVSR